jgi:glycosyltransferase involved in cell wall biosynthesis
MRLCFLGDVRSTHIQKFVKYFSKDHETHLVSFNYDGDARLDDGIKFFEGIGTDIHLLNKNNIFFSPIISRSIIRSIKPDLVQAHFVTNYGFLGAFSGVHPLVISAMGDDILVHPEQSKFYYNLVMYALHKADFVTCDGLNSTAALWDFGVPREKTAVIYPGINMSLFHPSKRVKSEYKTVFYPRGFDKIYDTDTLFLAMKIIHQRCPDVRFELLGIGTEFERFRNAVLQSGLWKVVSYLGHVRNEDLPEHYASADVSVTTSLSDGGIPVSTIEAMACGTPVVSTNAGDALLWLGYGAGYVVDKQNPEMVADKVINLLQDEKRRLEYGKRAREMVEKTQDYTLEMQKIENLYRKLIINR